MTEWQADVFVRIGQAAWWDDWLLMWEEIGWTEYFHYIYGKDD